jgi:N-acetylglutamate synthase/N-acetylornithine aminotransferase
MRAFVINIVFVKENRTNICPRILTSSNEKMAIDFLLSTEDILALIKEGCSFKEELTAITELSKKQLQMMLDQLSDV